MKINASWIDVGPPLKSVWGVPDGCCPMPRFTPNTDGGGSEWNWEEGDVVFLSSHDEQQGLGPGIFQPPVEMAKMENKEAKYELHKVLSSIQASEDLGVYLCESFRDPRREYMDDYLAEVMDEAVGIDDLHRLLGRAESALSDKARTRFNHLSRLLERLSKRIDRVLQQA